ncbi:MAG: hypothetical protein Q8M65_01645 [Rhodoglobus sp.]|nr:hypothetical protein [Rhodoglobus sp.]
MATKNQLDAAGRRTGRWEEPEWVYYAPDGSVKKKTVHKGKK